MTRQLKLDKIAGQYTGPAGVIYEVQCYTSEVARNMTGDHRQVTSTREAFTQQPPFCLRVVKPYRTANTQAFRDKVAQEVRNIRLRAALT